MPGGRREQGQCCKPLLPVSTVYGVAIPQLAALCTTLLKKRPDVDKSPKIFRMVDKFNRHVLGFCILGSHR